MAKTITASDVAGRVRWTEIVEAMRAGHQMPKAVLSDQLLRRGDDVMLSRAAWIDGLGTGVKSVTVYPDNPAQGRPTVQGAMVVFDDASGAVSAVIDSAVVTAWKTAGDSVFGASLLARPDSASLLIIGAGVVAETLVRAYCALFPQLEEIAIWNRTPARAGALAGAMAADGHPTRVAADLAAEVGRADIVATATMSAEPVLHGAWVRPGTHVDLIGAFTPAMREADDALLRKGALFVDSYDTTLDHIGELKIPLETGAITRDDVQADFYELVAGAPGRSGADAITVFKNGGGAHLDLMTAGVLMRAATGE